MIDPENKKYVKLGITGALVVLAGILLTFMLFNRTNIFSVVGTVLDILTPFFYGFIFAYLLSPLCNKLEKMFEKLFKGKCKKLGDALSIIISLIFALIIITALVFLIIPSVLKSVTGLINDLPSMLDNANDKLNEFFENSPDLKEYWDSLSGNIITQAEKWINSEFVPKIQEYVKSFAGKVIETMVILKNIFIGIVVAVYLLARRKQLFAQATLFVDGVFNAKHADMIKQEVSYIDKMFKGFFTGKIIDSFIIGMLCFIGCVILGFTPEPLISVIVGVTNIIPIFGPFIGAVPCAFLLLLEDPMKCFMFVIFILILQQLDGNVIGPKILGESTGLPGLWVLFSILLFGGLWGVGGMIVGVPLFAVIYDIIRRIVYSNVRKRGNEQLIEDYNQKYHPKPPVKTVKKRKADKKGEPRP